MASSNEIATLAQVATEIDESEVKITFANQCIKAQEALANKLKEEIQRRKQVCNYKKNENVKLEAEIKNAELELKNLRLTHNSIKSTNTEIRKQLLLSRERNFQITERIKKGEKKYEDLWLQCQQRYESIPLVQKLIQSKNKCEELKKYVSVLETEAIHLAESIKVKKDIIAEKDKKQIIELAEFFIRKMPASLKALKEKLNELNDLKKQVEIITSESRTNYNNTNCSVKASNKTKKEKKKTNDGDWSLDNSLMMPRLQLPSIDEDVFNFKLDINKVTLHTSPVKRTVSVTELENNPVKRTKPDENLKDNYISCYFNKHVRVEDEDIIENATVNYSNKKLINILENIQIDDKETYEIVAQANIDKFEEVDIITPIKNAKESNKSNNNKAPLQSEVIEELDLTNPEDIVNPPTQFLDLTQGEAIKEVEVDVHVNADKHSPNKLNLTQTKNLQEIKKVSFDMAVSDQNVTYNNMNENIIEDENLNGTVSSELNLSTATDDNYKSIKDLLLKKHHLDLSPRFIYSKNNMLQKRNEREIVTSKFFDSSIKNSENANEENEVNVQEIDQIPEAEEPKGENKSLFKVEDNLVSMDADNAVSSPKLPDADRPVTGLLFTHGPQGMPDCLDMSISTTGYDEGDSDFPTCLDSSLLLSPKADIPMSDIPMSENQSEVGSQDVPNFLTGFRKTGLSFFKQKPSENNAEINKNSQENNFNFNFGSDDRKNRGGLFSFFR